MLGQIQGLLMTMRLWDALDILVVAFSFTGCISLSVIRGRPLF